MSRKEKLEAGLENLFSKPTRRAAHRKQPPPDVEATLPITPLPDAPATSAVTDAPAPEVAPPKRTSRKTKSPVATVESAPPEPPSREPTPADVPPSKSPPAKAPVDMAASPEGEPAKTKLAEVSPATAKPPVTHAPPAKAGESNELVKEPAPKAAPARPKPVAPAKRAPAIIAEREEQLVVFTLNNAHYGLDIAAVESVIPVQPITTVPGTPAFICGLTNLRGTVLPVVDLRTRCGLPEREPTRETRIVVVEVAGTTAGMIVDAVTEVLVVPMSNISPPSPTVTTVDSAFIQGLARVGDERVIILLDLEQVIRPQKQGAFRGK